MKFTKMSLVAALLIGSSAFAIENTKVTGDANVFYNTTDAGDKSMLEAGNSAADIGLNLNVTTDLAKTDAVSISAGAGMTVLTTLGLENVLVDGVWGDAHTASDSNSSYGAKVDSAAWVNEAWIAATAGKTTAKVGRMSLDTPLAFTETWSIEKNTFEAAVLINQDIPDTTLVGAYVGNGNGTEGFGSNPTTALSDANLTTGAVVNSNGEFTTFGSNGAYAVGAINNSFKPLTVQAWYYDVLEVVQAYWLQADLNMAGVMAGAQYSAHTVNAGALIDGSVATTADISSDVYALMLGYEMKDMFTAKVSYSQVGKDFAAGFNTATATGTAQSKLYTEAWWNYGKVTQADSQSFNVTVESPVNGLFDLGVYYTNVDQASDTNNGNDLSEFTLTAGKSMGPVDATVAYIYADVEDNDPATENTSNSVQAYLTVNF